MGRRRRICSSYNNLNLGPQSHDNDAWLVNNLASESSNGLAISALHAGFQTEDLVPLPTPSSSPGPGVYNAPSHNDSFRVARDAARSLAFLAAASRLAPDKWTRHRLYPVLAAKRHQA